MKADKHVLFLALALSLTGCWSSATANLYKKAVQMEQQTGGDRSYATIEAYREVIRADPNSSYADKAQKRIDAIQQRIEAVRALPLY
jgi:hypothetical protein